VFAGLLELYCQSVGWTAREEDHDADINGFAQHAPDETTLKAALKEIAQAINTKPPEFKIIPIANRNWVAENIKNFPPLTAGQFFICGTEYDGNTPAGKTVLQVPAGIAFGSGNHGSTKGCLLAIDHIKDRSINRALDMGCGSGILSLAIAKRWPARIVASDIDSDAVDVTQENAIRNATGRAILAVRAAGYDHPDVRGHRYDLIVSNILVRTLTRQSTDLARYLRPGGTAILSGLLLKDGVRVVAAHRRQGLYLHRRIIVDGWLTLVMRKRST
jgi:ribosomal protein L11 methyltransferase